VLSSFEESLAWGEIDLVHDFVRPFIVATAAALADAEVQMGLDREEVCAQADLAGLLATLRPRADQQPLPPSTGRRAP